MNATPVTITNTESLSSIMDNMKNTIPQLPSDPRPYLVGESFIFEAGAVDFELQQIEIGLPLDFGPVFFVNNDGRIVAIDDSEKRLVLVTQDHIEDFYAMLVESDRE